MNGKNQREAAKRFSELWKNRGYEKGESAKFWLSLLNEVYEIKYPSEFIRFEDQVKLDHTSFIDGYIPSTHVLIEQKSIDKDLRKPIRQSDGSLLSPFQQAKRYSSELPYSERPRWIVTCNFKEFHIYDMEKPSGDPEVVLLSELEKDYYRMFFLVNEGDENIKKEMEVSLQAGELIGVLYEALLKEYINPEDEETLKDLNILCVRLVFCFYAEDAGIFGRHSLFHDYLVKYNSFNFRDALINVFRVLDQKPEERDPYLEDDLAAFPYVNGGLFANEQIVIPKINDEIIDIILNKASANFDWSNISPTIFGGVFESTLNPETRRSGGMHYTSISNIHKVIDPLFMNELNEEFDAIKEIKIEKTKNKKLDDFQKKIASLKFFDPAAGSGNFLTETYLSLRRIENEIIKIRYGKQIVMGYGFNPIKVSIRQFYGIEINDFAVTVGKTALWIAESQMMKETEDIIHDNIDFLPLKSYANIIEANALRIDWEDVVSKNEVNYIMGNPPFVGARLLNAEQRADVNKIFEGYKKSGNLDYVSCWYKKCSDYIKSTKIECALVSTNSIVEGEAVGLLWKELFNEGVVINFAHTTFKWSSEARNLAQVHCVVIGFSESEIVKQKIIFTEGTYKFVRHINAYLLEAPDIFVERTNKRFSDVPRMHKGCQPTDGGNLIIEADEYKNFIKKEPKAEKYIKKLIGAREFLQNKDRYCLWLVGISPTELKSMPLVLDRVRKCKEMRLAANSVGTRKLAERPTEFRETYNYENYLVIPKLTSADRKYIPMGYFDKNIISTDLNYITENANLYHFGVLESNVHMAWIRVVCGRMGNAYRYSAGVVYNNFPWPIITDEKKEKIKSKAQGIINARALYPDSSLADLYNELTMPLELRKAHQENDKAVMEAYGFDWKNMSESECSAELMKMYLELNK